jgi:uncharacterized protein (TIGR03437 family)
MGFLSRFLTAALILASCEAHAQTTTPITFNFDVDYVLGITENTYTGSGTIAPFGNATFQAVETFTGGVLISVTFTVANGSTFQATATSASVGAGGCVIPFTIAGGRGEFTNATGSLTVNYACSPNVQESGSLPISGTGSITTTNAGGVFSVSPLALSFSFLQGSPSSSQQITLNNGTTQAVPFTVTASAESWLSISPASGSVPALQLSSESVSVNPAGLAPGTYTGAVTISAVGQQFPVSITVTVNAAPEALALSQTSLLFQVASGAGAPPSQSITVLNQGVGTLNWSASASTLVGSWLSVTPASGTSGNSAAIAINPANLQPGNYYGLVQFTANGAANSPQSVVVVLKVLPATTVVATVAPTGLIFIAPQGGTPAAQTVTVTNSSNQSVTVNATAVSQPNGLLTINSSSASVSSAQPAEFTVTANVAGLKRGVYTGILQFEFAGGALQDVTIRIIVTGAASSASPRSSIRGAAASSACTPTQLVPVSTVLGPNFSTTAAWPTAMQIQVVDDCGSPMGPGAVTASFSTSDPALALTSLGSGLWSGTWQPEFVSASTPVVINVTAQSSQPALTGTLQINGTLQTNPATPSIGSVVSTASYVPNAPLAPGAFASIFGENLATSSMPAGKLPLTTQLAGAQAFIAGRLAPIQYASSGQINFLIPFDLAPNSTQQLIVIQGSAYSTPKPVTIAPAQPAVFTHGGGVGAITVVKANGDQFSADASHPAGAGDTLVIYCAGLGAVAPAVATGSAAPGSPPAKASNTVTVTIGGEPAPVAFAGLTPTYAGLYQVNVTVPSGITAGPSVPVIITAAGLSSPPVTVAIK